MWEFFYYFVYCYQGCFFDECGYVCICVVFGFFGEFFKVNIICKWYFFGVDFEYFEFGFFVWSWNEYQFVEFFWFEECWIDNVWFVGGINDDYVVVFLNIVYFGEQLVDQFVSDFVFFGFFGWCYCIDFVYEYYCWSSLVSFFEDFFNFFFGFIDLF